MTEEANEKMLEYLTGKLEIDKKDNIPDIEEYKDLENNVYLDLRTILLNNHDAKDSVVILGKIHSEIYSVFLVYGYYQNKNNNNYYGFVHIVDDKLNVVDTVTQFDSGTKLFPITALNQDESGLFYGLSSDMNGTSKVLLFNNILASGSETKKYKVTLRNSYTIPYNYSQIPYRQNRIVKSPDGATYYIIMNDSVDISTSSINIIKFSINVGSSNEWNEANTTTALITKYEPQFGVLLDKEEDVEVLKLYYISGMRYCEYLFQKDDDLDAYTITTTKNIQIPYLYERYAGVSFLNSNEIYVHGINNITEKFYLYKIEGSYLKTLYETDAPYDSNNNSYYQIIMQLFKINNGTFYEFNMRVAPYIYRTIFGYIKGGTIKYDIDEVRSNVSPLPEEYRYVDFYYFNNYNLVNIFVPKYMDIENYTTRYKMDFNIINYNGDPYVDTNIFVPTKGRAYGEDGLIFARNLYNKTITGNVTTSTLNIPNSLLNNVVVNDTDLIGETNKIISVGYGLDKNVYESVNVNFINSIRMVNNNDDENMIYNSNGSIRFNETISQYIDYNDAKATKLRINYEDDTSEIKTISEGQITILDQIPKNVALYTIMIYSPNDKDIKNLEILSNDENTIYQTITGEFERNKYYKIRQKVYVLENVKFNKVYYDEEQLYYNDERVYY